MVNPVRPLARLGESHGYRLEGDAVHLRATFRDIAPAANDHSWALQLWACPVGSDARPEHGHRVAEAWLPPFAEFVHPLPDFDVVAAATPPAGVAEWTMVLVLAAARDDGCEEVHDLVAFPRPERFHVPRFEGDVRHAFEGTRVHLDIAQVVNPRDARNLSGTLSIELWALGEPYTGGVFQGHALAGTVLGTLNGQERWRDLALNLAYTAPPTAGKWHPVLMLREWVGHGYLTRDFANLAPALVVDAPPLAPAAKALLDPGEKRRADRASASTVKSPKRGKKARAPKA